MRPRQQATYARLFGVVSQSQPHFGTRKKGPLFRQRFFEAPNLCRERVPAGNLGRSPGRRGGDGPMNGPIRLAARLLSLSGILARRFPHLGNATSTTEIQGMVAY